MIAHPITMDTITATITKYRATRLGQSVPPSDECDQNTTPPRITSNVIMFSRASSWLCSGL